MKYKKHAIWLFCGALIYAMLRYNVFGDVAWGNLPLYVANKAISWAGLALFGFSIVSREKADRRGYGTLAVVAIAAHVVMSLMVLNPAYFAKFFAETGRLNGTGEYSMLAGVLGMLFMGALFTLNLREQVEGASLRSGWGRAVLCCGGAHVLIMGFAGWLTPGKWPGYMPPITLISFLTVALFLILRSQRKG